MLFFFCFVFAVRICLYVPCGHLLGKGWSLGFILWCLTVSFYFPIGILCLVWYLIVSIPDLCTLTYFESWTGGTLHRNKLLPLIKVRHLAVTDVCTLYTTKYGLAAWNMSWNSLIIHFIALNIDLRLINYRQNIHDRLNYRVYEENVY